MKLRVIEVNKDNQSLAIELQAKIFPKEKSPEQIKSGVETGNPKNFIVFNQKEPVGIVGYYFSSLCPEHVLINWYGVLKEYRRQGYGTKILNWLVKTCKKLKYNYLTTYTGVKDNKDAILLYKKLGFDVVDYSNEHDLNKMKAIGIKHKYVLVSKKLRKCKDEEYKNVNLDIAGNYLIYTK